MNVTYRKLNNIAASPWTIVIGIVSSFAAIYWYRFGAHTELTDILSFFFSTIALLFLFAGYIYSIKVRIENKALRDVSEEFYQINQIYKNKLNKLFGGNIHITDPEILIAEEEQTLKAVCQRIDNIFSRVLNRNCMVTVKLVTMENNKLYAHTYVRSEDLCLRDALGHMKYLIATGENTGFDAALAVRKDGLPSHFFSPDLRDLVKRELYSNQRQNFIRYYKSALVVPIRGIAEDNEFDLIGFLCVDSMSANRLNNSYHLFMLAALADQMYNFISLMRGKYTVIVE